MTVDAAVALRRTRESLVADGSLVGRAFGARLADELDSVLTDLLLGGEGGPGAQLDGDVALVALGSYGRRELCPGSDVDVVLLHRAPRRRTKLVAGLSEHLWYPLWDAGFVTGHGTRTVKESLALAVDEPDVLTAMLQARHIAGSTELTAQLISETHKLVAKRGSQLVDHLALNTAVRRARPGPIAEVLDPDVKDGAGGLRDIQSLDWSGWTFGEPGGLDVLCARGYLSEDDRARLDDAADLFLEIRVAHHRHTGGRSDRLVLEDQDVVAASLAIASADELIRRLSSAGREVAWIAADVFDRIVSMRQPPRRHALSGDRTVDEHVVVRDGRVTLVGEAPPTALTVLELAVAAAELELRIDRRSLAEIATMQDPTWDVWERAAFLRLLRAGAGALAVFEALDHAGVLVRLLPEWEHVRSLPQRNAYHRFTVDRHLLEAVAECSALLDAAEGDEGDVRDGASHSILGVVARACRRPELLLLAALLHDLGKGYEGDHSKVGAEIAATITRRIGLDAEGREIIDWLVRDHLLMADTATRRDLSDAAVIERFADTCVGDPERLRLIYLLTVGDSKATGPAAWSATKDALLADLFVKAAHVIEARGAGVVGSERRAALAALIGEDLAQSHLARFGDSYGMAFDAEEMARHRELLDAGDTVVDVAPTGTGDRPVVTVVAPDRLGLLASIAGALTISGLSVREAFLYSTDDGRALDVFRVEDPFGRLSDGGEGRTRATIERAIAGDLDVEASIRERVASSARRSHDGPVEVTFDLEASDVATVVEVEAPDQVGLLYDIASTLAAEGLDVSVAKVLTLAARIVDVFYVADADGHKPVDPDRLERLRSRLVAGLEARVASSAAG